MAVQRQSVQPTRGATPKPGGPSKSVVGNDAELAGVQTKPKRSSFASAFDETPPATGMSGSDVPPGKYEAIITYAALKDENDKGQAVLIKYEIADEGDSQGKTLHSYYTVFDKSGGVGKGMGFLRRDLAKLGYSDLSGEQVEEALEEVAKDQLGVAITVKVKDGWTNVYLDGIVEDSEIIDAWKAEHPETPSK